MVTVTYDSDYLEHHGILGQKWGVRRYQNEDGSLTTAGQKRYNKQQTKADYKQAKKDYKLAVERAKIDRPHTILASYSSKDIAKQEAIEKALAKAGIAVRNARVNKDLVKSNGSEKAAIKAYAKELRRTGLPDSYADISSNGASKKFIASVQKQRGEEFADKVMKKAKNQLVGQFATAMTVSVGALVVTEMLANK